MYEFVFLHNFILYRMKLELISCLLTNDFISSNIELNSE